MSQGATNSPLLTDLATDTAASRVANEVTNANLLDAILLELRVTNYLLRVGFEGRLQDMRSADLKDLRDHPDLL